MNTLTYLAQIVSPDPLPKAPPNSLHRGFIIFYVTIGALTVLLFVYSGLQYVLSEGDPQKIAQAKTRFLHIIFGLAIIVTAGIIVQFIIDKFG